MSGSRHPLRAVNDDSFGSRLRNRRRTDDLTQAELGHKLGVSQQTIGAWERGERPQSGKLDVLARYLRMDKQRLVWLIDDQRSPGGQVHDREAPEEPAKSEVAEEPADGDAAEESTGTNDEIMRRLANQFLKAEKKAPLSAQRAEAYRALFEYFGRDE